MTAPAQLDLRGPDERLERVLDQVTRCGDNVRAALDELGPEPKGRAKRAARHLVAARSHLKSALIHGGRLGLGAVLASDEGAELARRYGPPELVDPPQPPAPVTAAATEAARRVDRHALAAGRVVLNVPGAAAVALLELVEQSFELELDVDVEQLQVIREQLAPRVARYRSTTNEGRSVAAG